MALGDVPQVQNEIIHYRLLSIFFPILFSNATEKCNIGTEGKKKISYPV